MLWRLNAVLIGILGLALAPARVFGAGPCKLVKLEELPVTMEGLKPLVTARINGSDALFLADSGAFFSMLSAASAAELKLPVHPAPFNLTVTGIGGSVQARVAVAKQFALPHVRATNVDFVVGGGEAGSGAVGILGQNVFRIADVEYDLANGVIRLWRPESCRSADLAYWNKEGESYSLMEIDWATPQFPHTTGVAFLNGTKIKVMFDTGASTSMLTRRAAERAGVTADSPGARAAGVSHGIGQGLVPTWIGPFQSFKIGDEEIRNTRLRFGDIGIPGADMLVGADFFLSHRVYVASSQRKLYFTYNGGPVFNLATSPNSQQTKNQTANPAAPVSAMSQDNQDATGADATPGGAAPGDKQANNDAGGPTDAEGLARRGAAFAARRDFEHAIADLTRACELAPQEPRYFYERAEAYWANRQGALANADIQHVLELKPDDVRALLWRARRKLQNHIRAGVVADLDTVDRTVAPQSDVRLELGALYVAAEQIPQGISQLNRWMSAHRDDARMAAAYNERCRARALLGQELGDALSDCNKALRANGDNAAALQNRGLVRLRTGDLDRAIADYTAALKVLPGNPWSLYGRGIAESHKQKTAAAEGDLAAATALAPRIGDEFKKLGLAP